MMGLGLASADDLEEEDCGGTRVNLHLAWDSFQDKQAVTGVCVMCICSQG